MKLHQKNVVTSSAKPPLLRKHSRYVTGDLNNIPKLELDRKENIFHLLTHFSHSAILEYLKDVSVNELNQTNLHGVTALEHFLSSFKVRCFILNIKDTTEIIELMIAKGAKLDKLSAAPLKTLNLYLPEHDQGVTEELPIKTVPLPQMVEKSKGVYLPNVNLVNRHRCITATSDIAAVDQSASADMQPRLLDMTHKANVPARYERVAFAFESLRDRDPVVMQSRAEQLIKSNKRHCRFTELIERVRKEVGDDQSLSM